MQTILSKTGLTGKSLEIRLHDGIFQGYADGKRVIESGHITHLAHPKSGCVATFGEYGGPAIGLTAEEAQSVSDAMTVVYNAREAAIAAKAEEKAQSLIASGEARQALVWSEPGSWTCSLDWVVSSRGKVFSHVKTIWDGRKEHVKMPSRPADGDLMRTDSAVYLLTADELKAVQDGIAAAAAVKSARIEADKAATAGLFAQAAATGQPVKLYHFTDDCNDPGESCNTDTITGYAMPDGSTKEERHHCW